jgi:hypothetical protein
MSIMTWMEYCWAQLRARRRYGHAPGIYGEVSVEVLVAEDGRGIDQ